MLYCSRLLVKLIQKAGDFDDQTFEPASSRHEQVREALGLTRRCRPAKGSGVPIALQVVFAARALLLRRAWRKRRANAHVCITAGVQVRSGDKSVKSLSVKQPQADFFLSPCQNTVANVHKTCYYVIARLLIAFGRPDFCSGVFVLRLFTISVCIIT